MQSEKLSSCALEKLYRLHWVYRPDAPSLPAVIINVYAWHSPVLSLPTSPTCCQAEPLLRAFTCTLAPDASTALGVQGHELHLSYLGLIVLLHWLIVTVSQ